MTMYVITHKHFYYQNLPNGYMPLLVGANKNANPDNFLTDNTGNNISAKNVSYCEETGLYWIIKNTNDKNIGISHYRRYFANFKNRKYMLLSILLKGKVKPISTEILDEILKNGYAWIVSQQEAGGPGTIWNQFALNHNIEDLKTTEKVISDLYPEYLSDFEQVIKNSETGSFYNMFYTSRQEAEAYSNWLFDILFEVEKQTNIADYDSYQKRLYGFLAERLMNVWLHHRKAKVKYLPVFDLSKMDREYAWKKIKGRMK